MDRSIPHIRSIFSTPSRKKSSSDTQDLCQYDKSPRNGRRSRNKEDYIDPPKTKPDKITPQPKKNNKENKEESRKNSNRNSNYNTYTSKTLTERDMRHLERHLSMKKTIRKQISRNLAQAFLENPDIFEPDDQKSDSHKTDHLIPSSKDIPNSEQNVLDLLKISIEDRDSGHSSPSLGDTTDDDDPSDDIKQTWRLKHRDSETRGLVEDKPKHHHLIENEKKTSSIWRMFTSKSKSRR